MKSLNQKKVLESNTDLNHPHTFSVKILEQLNLPPFNLCKHQDHSAQIACYLSQLMAKHQTLNGLEHPVHLEIPSVIELVETFHCTELDILDALYEMKKDSYEYTLMGLDALITLYDPQVRQAKECGHNRRSHLRRSSDTTSQTAN